MNPKDQPLAELAFHEAGHTVMAYLVGAAVMGLGFKRDGDGEVVSGYATNSDDANIPEHAMQGRPFQKRIMVILGGMVASHIFEGDDPSEPDGGWGFTLCSDDPDAVTLDELLEKAYPRSSEAARNIHADRLYYQVRQIFGIPRVWVAIDALATELLTQGNLEGHAAFVIVNEILSPLDLHLRFERRSYPWAIRRAIRQDKWLRESRRG